MEQVNKSDLISRLASKAKKKLSKNLQVDEIAKDKTFQAVYVFRKSETTADEKNLQKKIVHLIENNPDCDDPIGRLIDHKIYDKLSDSRKQAYILKLSSEYHDICERLKS